MSKEIEKPIEYDVARLREVALELVSKSDIDNRRIVMDYNETNVKKLTNVIEDIHAIKIDNSAKQSKIVLDVNREQESLLIKKLHEQEIEHKVYLTNNKRMAEYNIGFDGGLMLAAHKVIIDEERISRFGKGLDSVLDKPETVSFEKFLGIELPKTNKIDTHSQVARKVEIIKNKI